MPDPEWVGFGKYPDRNSAVRFIRRFYLGPCSWRVSILWSAEIFMHKRCFTIAMQKMDADIRKDITIYLVDSGYTTFHKNNPSVYVSWLTNDINTINEYGFECLEMAIAQAITIVMSIATIISFHYSLIITILVLFVIMYFVPKLFSKVMNRASLKASKAAETATRKISDFLAGFDDLLVMNLKKHIVEAINQSSSILKKQGKTGDCDWKYDGGF